MTFLPRAGMRVIWQSEIDPYACAVLRKHWPHGAHRNRAIGNAIVPQIAEIIGRAIVRAA